MSSDEILSEYSKARAAGRKAHHAVKPRPGSTGKRMEFYIEDRHIGALDLPDVYAWTNFQLDNRWLFE